DELPDDDVRRVPTEAARRCVRVAPRQREGRAQAGRQRRTVLLQDAQEGDRPVQAEVLGPAAGRARQARQGIRREVRVPVQAARRGRHGQICADARDARDAAQAAARGRTCHGRGRARRHGSQRLTAAPRARSVIPSTARDLLVDKHSRFLTAFGMTDLAIDQLWLKTLEEVVNRAAHEVKDSLNGVSLNVEVVRSRAERPGAEDGLTAFATAASEQLELLTNRAEAVLFLARPARDPADVALVLRHLAALLIPAAKADGKRLVVDGYGRS